MLIYQIPQKLHDYHPKEEEIQVEHGGDGRSIRLIRELEQV
jgi:hypothetical protein